MRAPAAISSRGRVAGVELRLVPAVEEGRLGQVQSRPGLGVVGVGREGVGSDRGNPVPAITVVEIERHRHVAMALAPGSQLRAENRAVVALSLGEREQIVPGGGSDQLVRQRRHLHRLSFLGSESTRSEAARL